MYRRIREDFPDCELMQHTAASEFVTLDILDLLDYV